jgi:molybdopterin molybdotransferase
LELYNVVSIEEAKKIVNEEFSYTLDFEKVNVTDSVGRYCFNDIIAEENIPNFRRSTVDGYAVATKDVFGASEAIPAILDLVGEIMMGECPPCNIEKSAQCLYIPTGGMLPEGADSVVMVEYSSKLDENTILIDSPVAPFENVIQIGEDIKTGETIVKKGDRLRPYEIGVLSSLGIDQVFVYKKPVIGIISTGDEIVSADKKPDSGKVRDINTNLLWSSVMEAQAMPKSYGIIHDDFDLLKNTVDKALKECDIVLISGGSSVGTKDQTLKVINSYQDGGVLVHGLAVKPGKPTIIGKAHNKVIFGLPGHPLACSIIFTVLVRNYLDKLNGRSNSGCISNSSNSSNNEKNSGSSSNGNSSSRGNGSADNSSDSDSGSVSSLEFGVTAQFSINYHKAKGREEYLPVALERVQGKILANPIFGKSGLITSFSRAYGYIVISKNKEGILEGEEVEVFKF